MVTPRPKTLWFITLVLVLIALRFCAMHFVPLMETTEARYGEIARKMLETGNWLTLQDTYTSPFWAKPPLFAWLSAASMAVFGINEWAIRLPSLILSIGVAWLVFFTLHREKPESLQAHHAVLILSTGIGFFVTSGTVMTDTALLFSVTLSLLGFWLFQKSREKIWGYCFFAGLGLGLLAKGPLAWVLIGGPLIIYVTWQRSWIATIKSLPWLGGITLAVVIPGVWYTAAELKTPGFLDYFIMGEHVYRFLKPGWNGDLYGFAHATPRGIMLAYIIIAILPWSIWFLINLLRNRQSALQTIQSNSLSHFILCWLGFQCVFLSLPANTIWPYFLPMAPALAMLMANTSISWLKDRLTIYVMASLMTISLVVAMGYYSLNAPNIDKSGKNLVSQWQSLQSTHPGALHYLASKRLFSIEFYSNGQATLLNNSEDVTRLLHNQIPDYLIAEAEMFERLPTSIQNRFIIVEPRQGSALNLLLLSESR